MFELPDELDPDIGDTVEEDEEEYARPGIVFSLMRNDEQSTLSYETNSSR